MSIKLRIFSVSLMISIFLFSTFAQDGKSESESYKRGKAEAAADIEKNIFVIKAWGLPPSKMVSWPSRDDIYSSILKDEYKITFDWVGLCMIDQETLDYATGYNQVSRLEIALRHGEGVFEKVWARAFAEYETKYGEQEREWNRKFKEALSDPSKWRKLTKDDLDLLTSLPGTLTVTPSPTPKPKIF